MYITVNDINMFYECLGTGREIILIHGNSDNPNYMKSIFKKLSQNYKVYFIHRRCSGKSEKNCKLSYENTAEDIYQFIVKMNIKDPVLIGHSGGAIVAMHLAIMYPECISKLVLCSGAARKEMIKFPKYIQILEKLWYPNQRANKKFYKLINESNNFKEHDLNKIKNQTLIVNGSRDIIPIEEAEYLAKNIPNSNLFVLPKESHSSYLINIKWYDKLQSFIDS